MDTLAAIEKQLRRLDRRDLKAWLTRGELLAKARDLLTDDGAFNAWLRQTKTPRSSAYAALTAWLQFGHVPTWGQFTREAMKLLAVDDDARREAIDLSRSEKITGRVARRLLGHKPVEPIAELAQAIGRNARRHLIVGDGFAIQITFERSFTEGDVLAALSAAARQVRVQMGAAAA